MRDCTDCITAEGNECVLYTGTSCVQCGLVTNTWYKVDDLITYLECAVHSTCGGTTTTTSTTTTTTTTEA